MQYAHIAAKVYNQPLLITPEKLQAVMTVLNGNRGQVQFSPVITEIGDRPEFSMNTKIQHFTHIGKLGLSPISSSPISTAADPSARDSRKTTTANIAVIPIIGSLVHRNRGFLSGSGLRSYQTIGSDLDRALADPEIDGIMLDVDSHGGEAAGCFDLADRIRKARKIKPVYAHANQSAYSAAYALFSAAEKTFVSRTSGIGSIGVIMQHVNQAKWNKKTGIAVTYIFAGKYKADGNPHEPLPDTVKSKLQQRVDDLRTLFADSVDSNRDLKKGTSLATEAGYFIGAEGVTAGLADAVATWEQALAELGREIGDRPNFPQGKGSNNQKLKENSGLSPISSGGSNMNTQERIQTLLENNEDAGEALAELGFVRTADAEALAKEKMKDQIIQAQADGKTAAINQTLQIVDMCALSGLPEMVKPLLESGADLEQARKEILDEKAVLAGKRTVRSTLGAESGAMANNFIEHCTAIAANA